MKTCVVLLPLTLSALFLIQGCAGPAAERLPPNQSTRRPVTEFPAEAEAVCRAHLAELRSSNTGGDIFDPTDPAILPSFDPPIGAYIYNPDFPRDALSRGLSGAVAMGGIIELDGTISNAKVLASGPTNSMDQVALQALERRRYEVAKFNDAPVRTYLCVRTTFDLG